MKYLSFTIDQYKGIKSGLKIKISQKDRVKLLVGINESGKSTILKAIFAFDYRNDDKNNNNSIRHLQEIGNKLLRENNDFAKINAELIFEDKDKENFFTIFEDKIKSKITSNNPEKVDPLLDTNDSADCDENIEEKIRNLKEKLFDIFKKPFKIFRKINKNIDINYFFSDDLVNQMSSIDLSFSNEEQTNISQELIDLLPKMYFIEELGTFKTSLPIKKRNELSSPEEKALWDIYNNILLSANREKGINEYVELLKSNENDTKRSDIEHNVTEELNKVFIEEWKKFNIIDNSGNLKLIFKESSGRFKIELHEEFGKSINKESENLIPIKSDSTFEIDERSAGFKWYFNFIIKLKYEHLNEEHGCFYLLDEPGMSLHEKAQKNLSERIKDLIRNNNYIIYTTHHFNMINYENTSIKDIYIVEKEIKSTPGLISAFPLSAYQGEIEEAKKGSFLPIIHSLQFSLLDLVINIESDTTNKKKILLVEGYYDSCFLKIFTDIKSKDVYIFPSIGANNIEEHVFAISKYRDKLYVLFDNDNKGRECKTQIEKDLYLDASDKNGLENVFLLPLPKDEEQIMMENFIDEADLLELLGILESNNVYIPSGEKYRKDKTSIKLKELYNDILDELLILKDDKKLSAVIKKIKKTDKLVLLTKALYENLELK